MSALLYSHLACLEHDPGAFSPGHPGTQERLVTVERALAERDWLGWRRLQRLRPPRGQLALALERPRAGDQGAVRAGRRHDRSRHLTPSRASFEAARHAAGAGCALVGALLSGRPRSASAQCAPPATTPSASARWASACSTTSPWRPPAIAEHGLDRVFVLDWDVHHGNGGPPRDLPPPP
jgi:acetoin utilization deacetylase AcuC-like enzyme